MTLRPIVTLPDEKTLREVSKPVGQVDAHVKRLWDDMLETMYHAPGIGLAAIQIGVPQRLIVIDLSKEGEEKKPLFLANPEIVWSSETVSDYEEGCLSIPEYYEMVTRPSDIKVRYLDRQGEAMELQAGGLLATCLQHEIDHLNGVLFIDHISKLKRDRVVKKFQKAQKLESSEAGMRLVFMGTPDFAAETLKRLLAAGHDVACVYSQPPRPAGRGMELRPSPVHRFASEGGIEVRTPTSLKSHEEQQRFRDLKADAAVVVAYGLLLPRPVLDAPRLGCFNVHASLLPRWRGAAPIQRAVMAGDAETGVTIMRMEEGLDTGPMCRVGRVPITDATTAQSLHDTLAELGAQLMVEVLAAPEIACTPQPEHGVTYAKKIDKAEARIDFTRSSREVLRHIHGLSPFPGAWFAVNGTRVKVLQCEIVETSGTPGTFLDDRLTIACGEGSVRLLKLQREGKGAMEADDFLRGFPRSHRHKGWLMPRYRLDIEYDGAPFTGWQSQAGGTSVQDVLEKAVAIINGAPSMVYGAGRTDAGVHALGQVAHVDLAKPWDPFKLRNALNGNLRPHPVSVLEATEVPEDFHARFSATRRYYLYRILNRRSPPALDKGKAWWLPVELDADAMHEAAQHLVGKHDFTTFRAAQCQAATPVKTLDRFEVARYGELIEIRADARSFLHNQVRSMVGSLRLVGEGKWGPRAMKTALDARDRAACGPVAPPDGLYLLRVGYDAEEK